MLQYAARGLIGEAEAIGTSVAREVAREAEHFLWAKKEETLGAAAGAYMLLRLGELERLHDWTENLYNWFLWLPDGAVIRAEHLAREGRHDEAAERLLALETRGVPVFTDGLAYAVERLDVYAHTRPADARPRLTRLRDELLPFALNADFTRAFTTYAGTDPNRPGSTDIEDNLGGAKFGPDVRLELIYKPAYDSDFYQLFRYDPASILRTIGIDLPHPIPDVPPQEHFRQLLASLTAFDPSGPAFHETVTAEVM